MTMSREEHDAYVAHLSGPDWSEALGALWSENMGLLWNTARNTTRSDSDAEDAISDAFVALARRAAEGRLVVHSSFRALAVSAVRNAAVSKHRKVKREELGDDQFLSMSVDETSLPSSRFVASEEERIVAEAFAALPERARTILWLTEVEGLPPREVAEILGISPNNVAQVASRSRRGLRVAWIEGHLVTGQVDPACADARRLMPLVIADESSPTQTEMLMSHLLQCRDCKGVENELRNDVIALRGIAIAPLAGVMLSPAELASHAVQLVGSTTKQLSRLARAVHKASGGKIAATSGAVSGTVAAGVISIGLVGVFAFTRTDTSTAPKTDAISVPFDVPGGPAVPGEGEVLVQCGDGTTDLAPADWKENIGPNVKYLPCVSATFDDLPPNPDGVWWLQCDNGSVLPIIDRSFLKKARKVCAPITDTPTSTSLGLAPVASLKFAEIRMDTRDIWPDRTDDSYMIATADQFLLSCPPKVKMPYTATLIDGTVYSGTIEVVKGVQATATSERGILFSVSYSGEPDGTPPCGVGWQGATPDGFWGNE